MSKYEGNFITVFIFLTSTFNSPAIKFKFVNWILRLHLFLDLHILIMSPNDNADLVMGYISGGRVFYTIKCARLVSSLTLGFSRKLCNFEEIKIFTMFYIDYKMSYVYQQFYLKWLNCSSSISLISSSKIFL